MADTNDLNTLTQMLNLGGCYINCQSSPEDQPNVKTMEGVLHTLSNLIPVEINESPEQPFMEQEGY